MEVARASTHEPKLLLWIKGNFVSQRQSDPRQLLARGRRRGWCLTSRKHVKLAVFGFRSAVRAILDSLRKATNVFSARRRIIGSVSASNTSGEPDSRAFRFRPETYPFRDGLVCTWRGSRPSHRLATPRFRSDGRLPVSYPSVNSIELAETSLHEATDCPW